MPEEQDEKQQDNTAYRALYGGNLFNLVIGVYGPYAFGMASLLMIWFAIVGPELERRQVDYERSDKTVESLQHIVQAQAAMSAQMERTAAVLESIVARLESE